MGGSSESSRGAWSAPNRQGAAAGLLLAQGTGGTASRYDPRPSGKHGTTENNHDTHGNHDDHAEHNTHNDPTHTVTTAWNLALYDAGGQEVVIKDGVGVVHNPAQTDWSHAAHGAHSPHTAHCDSDNRPRYFVLAFMQRVE